MRKIVATLACRVQSERLYAKPLQKIGKYTVLEHLVRQIRSFDFVSDIVLAISEDPSSAIFVRYAEKLKVPFIFGNERDVLKRLIDAAHLVDGEIVFRMTTECPFVHRPIAYDLVDVFINNNLDYAASPDLPDGVAPEILSIKALESSHLRGEERHRSELCSLYIRENMEQFRCMKLPVSHELQRSDLRITIDYPEDLILCREIFSRLGADPLKFSLHDIINLIDNDKFLQQLIYRAKEFSKKREL